MYFQKNIQADPEFFHDWSKAFKAIVKDTGNFILFLDNLEAHVQESFRNSIKDLGGITWSGVPNATDIWQPVDGGYAATLKTLIKQEFFNWLDDEDNVEKWYGAESHITASEKCILIMKWASNADCQLNRPSYDKSRWRLFEKTGCLITAVGSEDDKINPEGLPNYKKPPLIKLDPSTAPPAFSIVPQKDSNDTENEDVFDDFEGENEMDNIELIAEDVIHSDGLSFDLFNL